MTNAIKKISLFFCNFLWILSYTFYSAQFFCKTKNIQKEQNTKLLNIVHKNQASLFGQNYKFKDIHSYTDYKKTVPIQEYEDLHPYIREIEKGKQNILTTEKVIILEPTSGSSGKKKYIPYTKSLKKEFQKAIAPWIFDVYIHYPCLFFSQSYWSISPQNKSKKSKKIVGFKNDSEYLSGLSKWFMKQIMAVPASFDKTKEMFQKNKYIGLISIWSPTFLNSIFNKDFDLTKKMKNIKFISAWGDSSSSHFLHLIKDYFPQAIFQPKGLLSTECFASFPLFKLKNKSILAYRSHFFEFLDSDGEVFLAHQLKIGSQYTLIVTTAGGLYRYNTHDVVQIIGFYKSVPVMQFCGRDNQTADFFGEKLNELFVKSACDSIFKQLNISPVFFVVTFSQDHYNLLIEGENIPLKRLSILLEKELEKNFHYKYCIELKQLRPINCVYTNDGIKKYIDFYARRGIKLGDIKFKVLDTIYNQENE